jgi:hypothetical protein
MTDRPRLIEAPLAFRRTTAVLQARSSSGSLNRSNVPAPSRLVLPRRLLVPASATVKQSLWVFRTPKQTLLKD